MDQLWNLPNHSLKRSPVQALLLAHHWQAWWFPACLAGLVLAMYAPSVRFGLIWDDPYWYSQGSGQTLWRLLTSLSSYQFYRPLTIWLNRSLVSPEGIVNARLAHFTQIGAHSFASVLVIPTLLRLGSSRWQARLGALVFATHPFAYQAVAWQAPQQPLTLCWVMLAYLAAEHWVASRRRRFLALSVALYTVALLTQESAVPFVALFFWPEMRDVRRPRQLVNRLWPLLHTLIAAAFVFAWLNVPRLGGVTGGGWDPRVLAYLLQGVTYPLAAGLAYLPHAWKGQELAVTLGLGWLVLAVGTWRHDRGRSALLFSALIVCGLAPTYMGLGWEYVQVGSRLFYPALLGASALWGHWLAPIADRQAGMSRRLLAAALALALLGVAGTQWYSFQRLYHLGTRHLAEAVDVIASQPDRRLLLVNFPDQIELKRAPYPLGWWGLILAPVVEDMSDFSNAATGRAAETRCLAEPTHGWTQREASPYRVDVRGLPASATEIWENALWADGVYLTTYGQDGSMYLAEIGDVRPDQPQPARFVLGGTVELVASRILDYDLETPEVAVEITWRTNQPCNPGDTFFVHLLNAKGQLVQEADGDAVAGLLPLNAWQPGWLVRDIRHISLVGIPPGDYALTIGAYNRETGERYPAVWADGTRVLNDEPQVETIIVP